MPTRIPAVNLPPTIFETFPRQIARSKFASIPTPSIAVTQHSRQIMASGTGSAPSFADYGVENTNIPTATGVELSDSQSLLVGSILDLFAGRPSKRKLTLWKDDAVFADNITKAEGRKQYEAQWYGLKAAFSEIQRLHCEVKSAGNPIEIDMKTRYKIKGIGSEQTIESRVLVHTSPDGTSITQVQDKWNNDLPEGAFAKAFRNLNSVTVPAFVSVPNSVEEEEAAARK